MLGGAAKGSPVHELKDQRVSPRNIYLFVIKRKDGECSCHCLEHNYQQCICINSLRREGWGHWGLISLRATTTW